MKEMTNFFEIQTTTGKIIKSFRKNFNITQKEIATAIGINESNMSAIENDKREIGIDLATRLGAFLGISPSILLFPNGQDEAIKQHKDIIKRAKILMSSKMNAG